MYYNINIALVKENNLAKFEKFVSFSYFLFRLKSLLNKFVKIVIISIMDSDIKFIKYLAISDKFI